ncbi:hypothetical protein J0H58_19060, partial [bacterium]|nr:hypothetical protein [bacterium]
MHVTDTASGATHVLTARPDDPFAVRFAAGGGSAAVLFGDRTLEVWDLASRSRRFTAPTPASKHVGSFDLAADGGTVARVDPENKVVRLWDVASGRELPRLPDQPADPYAVLAFSPDGRTLACGARVDDLPAVRWWDYRAGTTLGDVPAYSGPFVLAFSADGRRLAGGCGDGVRVWDPATRRPLHDWGGHAYSPWAVAWSPDGSRLVSGAVFADPVARVWDARTGRKLLDLPGHRLGVGAVAYSPNGRLIATSGQEGSARLWDATTGAALHRFDFPTWGEAVAFAADGRHLAATGRAGVHVFDVAARREVRVAPLDRSLRLWPLPGGDRVLVGLREGGTRVYDLATGRDSPGGLPDGRGTVTADGRSGLTRGPDGAYRRSPLAGGPAVVVTTPLPGPDGSAAPEAMDADQSPDGRMVAVGYRGGVTVVYEAVTAGERFRLPGHAGDVLRVRYAPGGDRVATSSGDETLLVWDATGGFLPAPVSGLADAWAGLASPDAGAGFAAVRWLAARPAEAVPYLAARVAPAPVADPRAVGELVARLGSPVFADREAATRELADL